MDYIGVDKAVEEIIAAGSYSVISDGFKLFIKDRLQAIYMNGDFNRLERISGLMTDICQLLDGWHQDGTAWSSWDESIRQKASSVLKEYYGMKALREKQK